MEDAWFVAVEDNLFAGRISEAEATPAGLYYVSIVDWRE
jgi:hypothetical protein